MFASLSSRELDRVERARLVMVELFRTLSINGRCFVISEATAASVLVGGAGLHGKRKSLKQVHDSQLALII